MGKYTLPELPYAYDALDPHIDAKNYGNSSHKTSPKIHGHA